MDDEWPPKLARSMEDWAAYWGRQRRDRRFRHDHIQPFLRRWKRRLAAPKRRWRQVRWFVQRGRHGWARPDTWNMDGYICRVLGEMTAELKRVTHGHPCVQDTACALNPPQPPCTCEQAWDDTLDRIAGPLLAYKTFWDHPDGMTNDEYFAKEKVIIGAAQDALRLLAEHLPALWD